MTTMFFWKSNGKTLGIARELALRSHIIYWRFVDTVGGRFDLVSATNATVLYYGSAHIASIMAPGIVFG